MQFKPHDYQKYAIEKIKDQTGCGLLLDMGLGKTVITLTAIADLITLEEVSRVLVIAPLQTAWNTWGAEIEKWDHTKHLKYSLVLGSAKQRQEAMKDGCDIYIINRENIQWLCDNTDIFPFDMVVIDELSSFKNPSAKRFKALRKKMPFVKRVVGLTGTPASNSYLDLWPEMYLLDRGERLGKTVGFYRQTYFHPTKHNGHIVYEWGLNDGAKDIIDNKLSDLCVSMKAKDYLNMPDLIFIDRFASMSDEERKIYDQFGRDHVLPDKNVVGINAATVQGKLLQMANGFVYDEDKNAHRIHDRKLDVLSELVEEAQGQNILVFYNFIEDKNRILKAFPQATLCKSKDEIYQWNNGKLPMMIAHCASIGHGVNLQAGGNIIVWFGLPWSLELYQQANARLYRQGQQNTVKVYHILTKDSHDLDVLNALNRKNMTQEALLEALKARLKDWVKI